MEKAVSFFWLFMYDTCKHERTFAVPSFGVATASPRSRKAGPRLRIVL